jgi:hypothetical protein
MSMIYFCLVIPYSKVGNIYKLQCISLAQLTYKIANNADCFICRSCNTSTFASRHREIAAYANTAINNCNLYNQCKLLLISSVQKFQNAAAEMPIVSLRIMCVISVCLILFAFKLFCFDVLQLLKQ